MEVEGIAIGYCFWDAISKGVAAANKAQAATRNIDDWGRIMIWANWVLTR